jgi:hypothetical protein
MFVPIVSFGTGLINLKHFVQKISVTQEEYGPTWIWDTKCESYQTPRSEESNVCSYPINASSPSALLIGDSHAAVLAEDFVKVSHELNLNAVVSTFEGCPYSTNSKLLESLGGNEFLKCLSHNFFITDWIKTTNPEFIVYSQRGILGYSRGEIQPSQKSKENFKVLQSQTMPLVESTKRFITIASVPELAPFSLFDRLKDSKVKFDKHTFTREKGSTKSAKMFELDTSKIICPKDLCVSRINGQRLYRDSNHLSKFGSELVAKRLYDLLQQELTK